MASRKDLRGGACITCSDAATFLVVLALSLAVPPRAHSQDARDRVPRLISGSVPSYPYDFALKGVEGTVKIDFIVGTDGRTEEVRAIDSPDSRLSQLAEAAVKHWLFTPGMKNGKLVKTHMIAPLVFSPAKAGETELTDDRAVSLGQEAMAKRDYEKAVEFFSDAIRLAPDPADAYFERGLAYVGKRDDSKATADFVEAAQRNPADARIYRARGACYFRAGLIEKSVQDLDEAVRLEPDSAVNYAERGKAYQAEGLEEEAFDDLSTAVALDPGDSESRAKLEALQSRRNAADPRLQEWSELRYRTFKSIWETVDQTYYDPSFGGVNWREVWAKYRTLLPQTADNAQLRSLLQGMVSELRRTHFSIIPREGAVFNPSERTRKGTTGAEISICGADVLISEVAPQSPAATAGIEPGDRITKLDGIVLAKIADTLEKAGVPENVRGTYLAQFAESRLGSAVGTKLSLSVVGADGSPREATLVCAAIEGPWSEPVGRFPAVPIRMESRRDPDGIAYLRFNVFSLFVMKQARLFLRSLQKGDGLIIDLRGNSGGLIPMASGISGLLSKKSFPLGTLHQRDGPIELESYPQAGAFAGPVAVLIDGQSASTSEILSAGLQEARRARIIGEPSAGAAMASLYKAMPTGDLFQYAVADATTPGSVEIEGRGVLPDEQVRRLAADLSAGRDPVIEAARRWLDSERNRK